MSRYVEVVPLLTQLHNALYLSYKSRKREMFDILIGIISGLITALVVSGSTFWYHNSNLNRRYSFIYRMITKKTMIQIVLPSLEIEKFGFTHETKKMIHNSPPNVLFMPFNESNAIATLSNVIERLSQNTKVKLVLPDKYDPSYPAIVVGGPSVNELSAKILEYDFPEFQIDYPDATAANFRGWSFQSRRNKTDNFVETDYGFVFSSLSSRKQYCFVLCGILAFGTAASAEYILNLDVKSKEGRKLLSPSKTFVAVEAVIEDYEVRNTNATSMC